jgi:asparagine synthase (glutamine-hydrolysing)
MCGFVVIASQTDQPVDLEVVKTATRRIAHRGPDGEGYWLSPDQRVGMGHCRLSLVGLNNGTQPLRNEDDSLHCVVNGEFYDFRRIRKQLQDSGHTLRTESDSEILLHAYEDSPTRFTERLRGEFAFTLWDERRRVLIAGRDRLGIKPLFYAIHDGKVLLASEVKSLWAAGVPAAWDHQNLYRYLTRQPLRSGESIFQHVRQVAPGHLVRFTGTQIETAPYWDFDYPRHADIDHDTTIDVYAQRLRDALMEAVKLRLDADVPVGAYLSGGLDSSVVTGMAAQLIGKRLKAFTVSFDRDEFDKHAEYDELAVAQNTAKHLGIDLTPVRLKQSDLADNFKESLLYSEYPAMSPHGVGKFLLSRAARANGYKCVLTGEGADELFGGYSIFVETMILHNTEGQDPATIAAFREALAKNQGTFAPHGAKDLFSDAGLDARAASRTDSWAASDVVAGLRTAEKVLGFVPRHWHQCREMAATQFLTPDYVARHSDADAVAHYLADVDVAGQLKGRDPLNQELYLYAKTTLAGWILNLLSDRMEMAHAIEGRLPILDHEVINCAKQIPVAMKIRGQTEKFILKEAARPFVTDEVMNRKKHGFFTPREFRPGPLEQLRQDVLRSGRLPAMFDRKRTIDLLDRQPQLDTRSAQQVQNASIYVLSVTLLSELFNLS